MTDHKDPLNDAELDALLETASTDPTLPPLALSARVLADAATVQAGFATPVAAAPAPALWQQIFALLGGWRGAGGLVLASAVGLWVGIAPPDRFDPATLYGFGAQSDLDLLGEIASDVSWLIAEEDA